MLNRIREYRQARGLSQRQLAEMTGVAQATICLWETGRREPTASLALSVAQALEVTLDDLLSVPAAEQAS